jgi:ubiquinone/menaquinone biosynthesis C-methylase UbiE
MGSAENQTVDSQAEAFAGRLFEAALGTAEILTIYIGDRLGFYRALRGAESVTPAQFAKMCSVDERYAREWLEQQAVASILCVDEASAPASSRRYSLPEAHAAVLTDPDSVLSMAPIARAFVSCANVLPQILDAFRKGGGVPWEDFGVDGIEAQGDFNRPWLLASLGKEYLPTIADVHERLQNGAAVADFACGVGWAGIAIAQSYPNVTVRGFDLDPHSIEIANKRSADLGLDERVSFEVQDIAMSELAGTFDLVIVVEAIHDLARPVDALRSIHKALAPDGVAIVADEKTAEAFTAPGDETERLFYGFSVLCCLPAGRSEEPSAMTGTVMRPDTFRGYASEAGFSDVDILDIPHDLLRFYRLTP